MNNIEIRKKFGYLIKAYLANEINSEVLESKLSKIVDIESSEDKLLLYAFHALQHFEDDEDIRKKDISYEEYLEKELKEIANSLIRNSSNIIEKVSFYEPKTNFFLSVIESILSKIRKNG